jgi:type IX secretion system substrate protein
MQYVFYGDELLAGNSTSDSLQYQNIQNSLNANTTVYPVYSAETRWGLQYMVSSNLPSLTPVTGLEHAKTLALADAAYNNGDYGTALSLINSFSATYTIESNWQSVDGILIKMQTDTLNSSDVNTLQSVAQQCPHSGGRIVWTARALLTAYYKKPMEYPNDCPSTGSGARVQNTAGIEQIKANGNQLTLYPNPSTGKLYISNFDASQKNANIEVTDVTGKLIAKQPSPINNGLVELNLDVNNGVYFVKVVTDNGNTQVQKVIITK